MSNKYSDPTLGKRVKDEIKGERTAAVIYGRRLRRPPVYRGHRIVQSTYQGLPCYTTPALSGVAANVPTLREWIDKAIAAREIKER